MAFILSGSESKPDWMLIGALTNQRDHSVYSVPVIRWKGSRDLQKDGIKRG